MSDILVTELQSKAKEASAKPSAAPASKALSLKSAERPKAQKDSEPAAAPVGSVSVDADVVEAMGGDRASKLAVYIDTTRRMLLDILGSDLFGRVYSWVKHDLQGSTTEVPNLYLL